MATITFKVNLETRNSTSHLMPSRTTLDGNETVTEASNMKNTRTIYLPGLTLNNTVGLNANGNQPGYYHHGDQFTVTGLQAIYLLNTYVSSPVSLNDVLQVVSQS